MSAHTLCSNSTPGDLPPPVTREQIGARVIATQRHKEMREQGIDIADVLAANEEEEEPMESEDQENEKREQAAVDDRDEVGCVFRRVKGAWLVCTVLLNEIQSSFSSTHWALRSPRPANTGLRKGVRRQLDSCDWISLGSTVHSVIQQYLG